MDHRVRMNYETTVKGGRLQHGRGEDVIAAYDVCAEQNVCWREMLKKGT